ncbi:hypothetical protein [Herbidospora sp. RD11066]
MTPSASTSVVSIGCHCPSCRIRIGVVWSSVWSVVPSGFAYVVVVSDRSEGISMSLFCFLASDCALNSGFPVAEAGAG